MPLCASCNKYERWLTITENGQDVTRVRVKGFIDYNKNVTVRALDARLKGTGIGWVPGEVDYEQEASQKPIFVYLGSCCKRDIRHLILKQVEESLPVELAHRTIKIINTSKKAASN